MSLIALGSAFAPSGGATSGPSPPQSPASPSPPSAPSPSTRVALGASFQPSRTSVTGGTTQPMLALGDGVSASRPLTAQPRPSTPATPADHDPAGMSPEMAQDLSLARTAITGAGKIGALAGVNAAAGGAQAISGLVGLGGAAYDLSKGGDPAAFAFRGASAANSIAQGAAGAAGALGAAGPALTPALNAVSAYAPYIGAAINSASDLYGVIEGKMDPRLAAINASLDSGLAVGTALSGAYAPITAVAGSFINPQIKKLAAEWFGPDMGPILEKAEAGRANATAAVTHRNLAQADSPDDLMGIIQEIGRAGTESTVEVAVHDVAGRRLGYLNRDAEGTPRLGFDEAYRAVLNGGYVNGQVQSGVSPGLLTAASEQMSSLLTSIFRVHGDAQQGVPEARALVDRARAAKQTAVDAALAHVRSPEYQAQMTWETDPLMDAHNTLGPKWGTRTQQQVQGALRADPVYQRQNELLMRELGVPNMAEVEGRYGARGAHLSPEAFRDAVRYGKAVDAQNAAAPVEFFGHRGGVVPRPAPGRSDVSARLLGDEHVIAPGPSRKYRPLIEAINADRPHDILRLARLSTLTAA